MRIFVLQNLFKIDRLDAKRFGRFFALCTQKVADKLFIYGHMIRFYNTLSKQKEEFVPLNPGKVGMYTCGPTVYGPIHIGNIRAYTFSDTIRRVLEDAGYEVRLIKNITDVGHLTADDVAQGDSGEDKIEKKARTERKTSAEIIAFYEDYFRETEKAVGILPAHYFPHATAHVAQMIKLIETLIAKGYAYEKNGNVFFDVTSFPDYGKLSGNTLEHLRVGARLEEHPDKKNPWDFALWLKAPKEHLMRWPSPWSDGYPGWHIECSAMSMEYLGDTLDIHTGGEDNIFPHHEAEIAQSECVTGKTFARYWLHTRHILVDGQKMSKSKGNSYLLEDIIEHGFIPADFRMLLMSAHYRTQMNFTWESLEQAKKNRETIMGVYARLLISDTAIEGFNGSDSLENVREAMRDDLNTPEAVAVVLDLVKKTNTLLDTNEAVDCAALIAVYDKIFFLFGLHAEKETVPAEVEALAKERNAARANQDFAESDRLRDAIAAHGYKIEDIPKGYRLKKS
jgi:cysteinyl-tRNA synthetase